ncbi:hypothetical protein BJV82DRAFT_716323 [Fennellomyces sp. T-0311]|nr:hypothetical protein BJV82DRAFT_716323 [Fennellomyces sp. T-0311]
MVSSSTFAPGRTIKSLFKDSSSTNNTRSSNVSLNSEPAPSASKPGRRMSHSASSSSHHHAPFSSARSEPPIYDRPLPNVPTTTAPPRSSSRPPISKNNKQRKEQAPFLKRFSRAHSFENDSKEDYTAGYAADYTAYLSMDSFTTSTENLSSQQPPLPPAHSSGVRDDAGSTNSGSSGSNPKGNNNNNNNGSSSSTTSSAKPVVKKGIPKSAVKKHQVARLVNELDSKDKESLELEHRYHKLQQTLDAKEAEYNRISANFHKHVMMIRATDDDFSTIKNKLAMLQTKIATVPHTLKKSALDRSAITQYFIQSWPTLKPAIDHLTQNKKGVLDYNIICLFVEKMISEELVASVYNAPVMIGLPVNDAFTQIAKYMEPHDKEWALRLRQQMCKLAVKSVNGNDDAAKPIASAKNELVKRLVTRLSHVYGPDGHQILESKIAKVVESASDLSAAMHGHEVPVDPLTLIEGKEKINTELATPVNGSTDNATDIQVVICPPFTASEKLENDIVLMKGKVICF